MLNLLSELEKCSKCGTCRSVCPVFLELKDELMVTRGRLTLAEAALKNDVALSARLRTVLDCCLMCLRCKEACPSLVQTDRVIPLARSWLNQKRGLPLPLRFGFRMVLPYKRLYGLFIKALSILQRPLLSGRSAFRHEQFGHKCPPTLRHIPLVFTDFQQRIPPVSSRPALSRVPGRYNPGKNGLNPRLNRGLKVAVFVGCLINYVYPSVLESLVAVLKKAGISFIIPKDQLCCGTPALIYGDLTTARRLARQNIKSFKPDEVDVIITLCASCTRMLKQEYPQLINDTSTAEFSTKVMDIMEFINQYIPFTSPESALRRPAEETRSQAPRLKTTYHKPCHATGDNSAEITRSLLKRISDYQDLDKEDRCCGGGGGFSLKHSALSSRIGRTKIGPIQAGLPDLVVTGCPGCMMQLRYLLQKEGSNNVKVCHSIEFYAKQNLTYNP